ncbi:hypothetical protein [Chamaesiphon sp. VAR_69_metabat_338]|uniref:hypothetical protein n=1 Tax=Chamaesiphon sp. VAR_69_metabat_338 TaxID=2964704 RepID=UPI00286E939B|nr:hypothetical protein [Chamaesiphon sp. VAR_69_metabat_338]
MQSPPTRTNKLVLALRYDILTYQIGVLWSIAKFQDFFQLLRSMIMVSIISIDNIKLA